MFICNPLAKLNGEIKGIIFDCDGVLFDSKDVNIKYYNWVKEMFGLPPLSLEEEEYVHMHSVHNSFKKILPPEFWPRIEEIRKKIDYSKLYPYLKMEPGLVELLSDLRQCGFKLAINTNRTNTMLPILEVFGLNHYFFPVITADKLAFPKPYPESLFLILSIWKLEPKEVAYIGDSKVDEECAKRAGVPFWSYKNPGLQAEMLIPDFYSLRQFLLLKRKKIC